MTPPYLFISFALLLTPGTRKRPPQSGFVQTGMWEMPNRGTSGIVGGSDITFRRHRRVVINPSLRLASFI
jgi:hypothetical protein